LWIAAGLVAVSAIALVLVVGLRASEDKPLPTAAIGDPPKPPPKPVEAPTKVTIRVASSPAGATVRVEGSNDVLGTTPFSTTFDKAPDRSLVLTFEKDGFVTMTERIELASDGVISTAMTTAPPKPKVDPKRVEPARTIAAKKPPKVEAPKADPPPKSDPPPKVVEPTPKKTDPPKAPPPDRRGTMDVFGGGNK
jgi:hypothetical protein